MLDEFFSLYFGAAAKPMQQFYALIEDTFCDPENYPREVREKDTQFHQTERQAWRNLGTEERMAKLAQFMDSAKSLAETEIERACVKLWDQGVWQYMVEGRAKYYAERE